METAVVEPKQDTLVRLGNDSMDTDPDMTVDTVYLGPVVVPMVGRRKIVDAYDPAKWPYEPETEYLADWDGSEA